MESGWRLPLQSFAQPQSPQYFWFWNEKNIAISKSRIWFVHNPPHLRSCSKSAKHFFDISKKVRNLNEFRTFFCCMSILRQKVCQRAFYQSQYFFRTVFALAQREVTNRKTLSCHSDRHGRSSSFVRLRRSYGGRQTVPPRLYLW